MYYDAKLKVTSASGCVDSMMMGITVYPQTESSFTLSADTICSGDRVTFAAQPGGFQYYWVYGDGQEQYGLNVNNHTYINGTAVLDTNYVSLTTTSFFGCTSETIQPVIVYPMPVAEFTASPPTQVFPAATVNFTNLTNPGTWTYLWKFGDGNTSTTFEPTHTYTGPGDYNVTLIVSNGRCTDSVVHLVRILPTPPIASFDDVPEGCTPWTIKLNNTSQHATSYLWEFGDGAISTSANPTYTYYNKGPFDIKLTVTGPGGDSTIIKTVNVFQTPRAYFEFAPEKVFVNDERVRFFNRSQWATNYIWDFADGDTSHVRDPFHKYLVRGIFDVTLHAYSAEGCYDSYTATPGVLVEPAGTIGFATAFIPDKGAASGKVNIANIGSGNMDKYFFPPITEQVSKYKLQIFNRWGVLIFESNDISDGWDGSYKGKLVKQGVYVWIVEGKYANGRPFSKSGDVTLLH
jgi:gliding motility-associated-like protein